MKFQFSIRLQGTAIALFPAGVTEMARVDVKLIGREVDGSSITLGDVQNIIQTEQLIEKLTGLRCHIEQVR